MPERIVEPLSTPGDERLALVAEVRAGLLAKPLRRLPCKFFYDDLGSRLFDAITRLPEYYLTRTEDKILKAVVPSLVRSLKPRELFELGSGMGTKMRQFLDAMSQAGTLERCVLLDISAETLAESVRVLGEAYPALSVHAFVGDFTRDLARIPQGRDRLGLFLGSTLGNLVPAAWPAFFQSLRGTLNSGEAFLVGIDLVKDPAVLHAAYNDRQGVTAAFNRNILAVVNRLLDADFVPEAFEHVAFFDPNQSWIEMRLKSTCPQRVRVRGADLAFELAAGEEIHTEVSCKATRATFDRALVDSGFTMERWFTDAESWFALALLRAGPPTRTPAPQAS